MTYGGTVVKRRMPKVRDFAPLIRFRKPRLDRLQQRLDDAQTIHDLRRIAQRRTPRAAFDYTDGAAEDEVTMRANRAAFQRISFAPRVLVEVAGRKLATTALGTKWRTAVAVLDAW